MRQKLRFTIRGLLIFVLAVSVLLAIWTARARKERMVSQTVRTFGGSCETEPYLPAPDWFVKLIGVEYFNRVQGIAIASAQFTDNDLTPLEGLYGLRTLRLTNTHITDAGIARLRNLSNLTTLELQLTDVTDDCVKDLKAFPQLEDLDLIDTEVTDKGLSSLPQFQKLERLWIGKCDIQGEKEQPVSNITDAGLSSIAHQTNLKTLVVYNTRATSDGFEKLKQALPGLKINAGAASRPNRRGDRFIEAKNRWVPEQDAK